VSPKLQEARDFELAVPGTYDTKEVINIRNVHASLQVITSKQRPRKLSIYGKHPILRLAGRLPAAFGYILLMLQGSVIQNYRAFSVSNGCPFGPSYKPCLILSSQMNNGTKGNNSGEGQGWP